MYLDFKVKILKFCYIIPMYNNKKGSDNFAILESNEVEYVAFGLKLGCKQSCPSMR